MKKNYLFILVLIFAVSMQSHAQQFVNQLLIGSGGVYGNPDDHLSLAAYQPVQDTTVVFGGVNTESIQDMVLEGSNLYVAAQDSIAKYDVDTKERLAIVACSNVNQLLVDNGKLYASRWISPEDGVYVRVFETSGLSWVADVEGMSGDAADLVMAGDTLYVAVNGGWAGTEGKLAVIDNNYQLVREDNLGTDAVGIFDLFVYDGKIYSVNRTPWGASTGSISTYDPTTAEATTTVLSHVVGKGLDRHQNTLYLLLDGNIASFDLSGQSVTDENIVAPATSGISAAVYDSLNERFYVAETDYMSSGDGFIYSAAGENIGSFEAGISTEALLLDIRADFTFDDVQYWVGSGSKQALFVVDWNDGVEPEALAWGYRWDGTATAEDMINEIVNADERLSADMSGGFLSSLAYESATFTHAGSQAGLYWSTWSGESTPDWAMNMGISTELEDGAWFGCSMTDFNPATAPQVPVAALDPNGIAETSVKVELYPNPVVNQLKISGIDMQKIEIYSLQGERVRMEMPDSDFAVLSLSSLRPGVYFLKIYSSAGNISRKFIKQ